MGIHTQKHVVKKEHVSDGMQCLIDGINGLSKKFMVLFLKKLLGLIPVN